MNSRPTPESTGRKTKLSLIVLGLAFATLAYVGLNIKLGNPQNGSGEETVSQNIPEFLDRNSLYHVEEFDKTVNRNRDGKIESINYTFLISSSVAHDAYLDVITNVDSSEEILKYNASPIPVKFQGEKVSVSITKDIILKDKNLSIVPEEISFIANIIVNSDIIPPPGSLLITGFSTYDPEDAERSGGFGACMPVMFDSSLSVGVFNRNDFK